MIAETVLHVTVYDFHLQAAHVLMYAFLAMGVCILALGIWQLRQEWRESRQRNIDRLILAWQQDPEVRRRVNNAIERLKADESSESANPYAPPGQE